CRRDSAEASAWQVCASPKEYSALADGAHKFEVRAKDQAGNADASPAAFSWTIDTTPPAATIDSGPTGLTNDPTPSFEFHASEGGSSFECSIDTGTAAYGPCSGAGSHTPASPLADGPYTFRVRATDAAGNQGAGVTRAFTVDTSAPPPPELNSTQPASPANENSPKLIGSAPAGSTVRLYESADCSGTPLVTVSAAQLAAGIAVSVADDSTTQWSATATSSADSTSPCSAPITYVEDSTAPQSQIDSGPLGTSTSTNASFTFSGSDVGGTGVASFECRLDAALEVSWTPCVSPQSYAALLDGPHSFQVRAVDRAGNADESPATRDWNVDASEPGQLAPRSPVRLLKIVYNVRRGTASLIFEVPSAGMLSASVPTASPRKNLRRGPGTLSSAKSHQIEPTSVRATQPGTVTLQIRLGSAGRKLLRESRKVKVTLQVSFAADGESAISRMLAITLKRRVSPRTQRPTAGPPR
ncbi:MAG: Ig-like domain-containing protein, partial [Thermoleophilia bacterium]